jgi:cytochrome c oxidase subunit 5b
MFLQRSAIAAARRAAVTPAIARGFATSIARRMTFIFL